ncbi:MAG: hypothetical protein SFU27_11040 [Thermonemataceae bacterium]|nr:hypothetical protein [Thermonemataceae bacterium]
MLNNQQADFVRKQEIIDKLTAEQWVIMLNDFLHNYKLHIDWQLSLKKKTAYARNSFFISLMVALFLGFNYSWWAMLYVLPTFIWYAVRLYKEKDTLIYKIIPIPDLENRIIEAFIPLFQLLSQDLDAKTLVDAKLSLKRYNSHDNKYHTSNPNDSKYNINKHFYSSSYLSVRTRFPDKSKIFFSITQKTQEQIKTRKYGKYKRKTKEKSTTIYTVKMEFNQEKYTSAPQQANVSTHKFPIFVLKRKENGLEKSISPILEMIAEGYRKVKPL